MDDMDDLDALANRTPALTPDTDDDRLRTAWDADRRYLLDIAYRMLGSIQEAEDVVQEGYTRLFRADLDAIDDVRGWLVVVVSRLCLDLLRSARARAETAVGPWLPEPIFGGPGPTALPGGAALGADPADRVTLDETVRMALLIVLEELTPAERAAFVLHDVFQLPFDEVGDIVGRSPAAVRKLASRARVHIREHGDTGAVHRRCGRADAGRGAVHRRGVGRRSRGAARGPRPRRRRRSRPGRHPRAARFPGDRCGPRRDRAAFSSRSTPTNTSRSSVERSTGSRRSSRRWATGCSPSSSSRRTTVSSPRSTRSWTRTSSRTCRARAWRALTRPARTSRQTARRSRDRRARRASHPRRRLRPTRSGRRRSRRHRHRCHPGTPARRTSCAGRRCRRWHPGWRTGPGC